MHPETPDRVIAGVEVGGVHVNEDRGETWTAVDETVLAGTNNGRLISRDSTGAWTDAGQVPAGIRSLEPC